MRNPTVVLLALLALTAPVGTAFADAQDEARVAFQQGIESFQSGDFEAAVRAFRKADELAPSWKLKYNIGQCEAALKHYGLAIEAFERYLAAGGDDVPAERRDEVIGELKRLREMVGSLDVTAPDGAVIIVDDVQRGQAPLPGLLKVAAGVDHALRIEHEGATILERSIKVSGGDTVSVSTYATDGGSGTGPGPIVVVEDSGHTWMWPAGWAALGVGVGVGATGVGLTGKARALDRDLKDVCTGGVCPPEYHDDVDRQEKQATAGVALLVAGSVVAVTGAVFLIVDSTRDKKDDEVEAAIAPTVGPDFAGLAIKGRF
jgi:hypothetical protein